MGSEQNEGTSYKPSEPKLCANNCGFFGSACTENLCSKCYRDSHIKASAKAAVEKSFQSQISKPSDGSHPTVISAPPVVSTSPSSSTSTTCTNSNSADKSPSPEIPNRCLSCKKKLGLLGFKCKCGRTFCGTHWYPEKHDCTFDFKTVARERIDRANPVVKPDKVERI